MAWFAGLCATALLVLAGVIVLQRRRGKISPTHLATLRQEWQRAVSQPDVVRRLLEAEKTFEHLLTMWRFTGTFADKLRTAGPRFPNVESLWRAHKLRNRIAHEAGFHPSEGECRQAVQSYEQALRTVLR